MKNSAGYASALLSQLSYEATPLGAGPATV